MPQKAGRKNERSPLATRDQPGPNARTLGIFGPAIN
jgi:hypothetical protein